jgi:hypothetical protein
MSNTSQKKIAFAGEKYSGKSTCVRYLLDKNDSTEEVSFALPLKEVCSNLFDIPIDTFQDPILKEKILDEYGVTPRDILIAVGDLLRFELPKKLPNLKLKRNILTDKAQRIIQLLKKEEMSIYVSDFRDPILEKDMLIEEGFTTVKIIRNDKNIDEQKIEHWTEKGVGKTNFEINNNGTLDDLYLELDNITNNIQ